MERLYPIFVKLSGVASLVVGGGVVATRKVRGLIAAGAKVQVISPECTQELTTLAEEELVVIEYRRADPSDVVGFRLVICATSDTLVNKTIAEAAQQAGALVNVVDAPELSSFFVPAVVERGRMQVAISTSGASPALAKRIRQRLEGLFGLEYQVLLEIEAFLRPLIIAGVAESKRQALFAYLAERLPEKMETAKSAEQLRQDLEQIMEIEIPHEFEQLVSPFFRSN